MDEVRKHLSAPLGLAGLVALVTSLPAWVLIVIVTAYIITRPAVLELLGQVLAARRTPAQHRQVVTYLKARALTGRKKDSDEPGF